MGGRERPSECASMCRTRNVKACIPLRVPVLVSFLCCFPFLNDCTSLTVPAHEHTLLVTCAGLRPPAPPTTTIEASRPPPIPGERHCPNLPARHALYPAVPQRSVLRPRIGSHYRALTRSLVKMNDVLHVLNVVFLLHDVRVSGYSKRRGWFGARTMAAGGRAWSSASTWTRACRRCGETRDGSSRSLARRLLPPPLPPSVRFSEEGRGAQIGRGGGRGFLSECFTARAHCSPSLCLFFFVFACVGVGGPWRTRQILHNLLSNAAKFTWAGFVSLRITSDRARGLLLISVSDRCSSCCASVAPRWHDSGRLAAWGAVGSRRILGRSRLSGPTGADWLLYTGQNSLAQRCQPIYSRLQAAH